MLELTNLKKNSQRGFTVEWLWVPAPINFCSEENSTLLLRGAPKYIESLKKTVSVVLQQSACGFPRPLTSAQKKIVPCCCAGLQNISNPLKNSQRGSRGH